MDARRLLVAFMAMSLCASAASAESLVERGKYLVTIMGCGDCHTPGALRGKPDVTRALSGSDVAFAIPGRGVFYGRNLTSDKKTGLGDWTVDQIIIAFTTGVRPDGRQLARSMPYMGFASLNAADAQAIAVYLKSLPPIENAVPGPFAADQIAPGLVSAVMPGPVYATLPKP